jgi:hypothetical protein
MKLFDIEDNDKDELPPEQHKYWEVTHFFFQHGRIPFKNKESLTLVRLMQLAYNAGQLNAEKTNKYNTKERQKYYKSKKLNSYKTYIPTHIANRLKEKLNNTQIIEDVERVSNNLIVGGGKNIQRMDMKHVEYKIKKYTTKLNYYKNVLAKQ